jgi:hypothetical protein
VARGVRWWVAVVLAACGLVAIAYLPPRGGVRARPPFTFLGMMPEGTPARRRAQALAAEWRAADGAVRLLEERARMRSMVSRTGHETRGPTILLTGVDAIPPSAVRLVESVMDSVWQNLGLADTKVRVGVVFDLWQARSSGPTPTRDDERPAYLQPDSTDRTTCIARIPVGRYWTRVILGEPTQVRPAVPPNFADWLKASLGPCAFHAAFGTPGRPVRRWLAARQWDVGRSLDWDSVPAGRFSSRDVIGEPRFSWYWERVYSFPPATVACLAGRTTGCRDAVLDGAGGRRDDSLPRVVRFEWRWWRTERLVPAERYLSDVARDVGRERFVRFWSSPLPVDTALAAALKKPVGEWTEEWQRRYIPRLRLGAAAPRAAALLALLLAVAAVTSAALSASRRQVR